MEFTTIGVLALVCTSVLGGPALAGASDPSEPRAEPDGSPSATAAPGLALPNDLAARFGRFEGCVVLGRLGTTAGQDRIVSWGGERCVSPSSPCSTFKIPHAIIALESGAVADHHEVIEWDGVERWAACWNRDHDMGSALENSVVWFFQETARRIGGERMQRWVDQSGYGNRDISSGATFWLDGSLKISPLQQVDFLASLVREDLPASARSARIVKRLLIADRREERTLHAKTGSCRPAEGKGIGWYVGWVERPDGPTQVFAVRIEGGEEAWGPEARRIARRILHDLDLFGSE